jgi:hypothetical protein
MRYSPPQPHTSGLCPRSVTILTDATVKSIIVTGSVQLTSLLRVHCRRLLMSGGGSQSVAPLASSSRTARRWKAIWSSPTRRRK